MATKSGFGARAASARTAMRIIKKYPNRRLYDTATSGYITLADVRQMVIEHTPFQVRDAKTNEELTRAILLQIILDEEAAGVPMFSNDMLAQMIRFYAGAMQGVMQNYLEQSGKVFLDMQQKMQESTKQLFPGFPFPGFPGNDKK